MAGGGGADSGQGANPKGWFESASDSLGGLLRGADPSTVAGGGVVSGLGGMAEIGGRAAAHVEKMVTDGVLSQYPGYGTLWTYDAATGAHVQAKGWIALGALTVAVYLLFKGK